ncbi:PAS domain-containing protein [Sphingomonas sp. R-74633]|uniref:PAS domain-containing protein n=1 Tax=Sphingomonas sp. R-74633 TaxID=2751188 RepID=UPI0015D39AF4|nr:PAS domain-containing protein [Sphingomonas sp. R-74633]NYT41446.1 PAS domain-containing protein [Sphingomonas sp. R-74633]
MSSSEKDIEIVRLRRGIDDLVALQALAINWVGKSPAEKARLLGEALFSTLGLDFIHIVVDGDGEPSETFAQIRSGFDALRSETVTRELHALLGEATADWPPLSHHRLSGNSVSIATARLGLERDFGMVAAGAARPGFPDDTEKLLLNLACNQALVALQQARLKREPPMRADELDHRVEQRTLELAAANAALKAEIAERERVEEAFRASELSATSMIEGIPGFVAVLGPDGRVERVNGQIEQYCGEPLEELQHWGVNGIVHPEDMPHVAEMFGKAIAAGTPYDIEQRLRRFDGEYRWFGNRGRPIRDADGRIVAWHVLLTDIDDRRRAEQAVRASEKGLREQAETIPQMLWSATADGDIDYCNERLLEYSGLTADEVMGGGWVNLLHPDDRAPTGEIWLRCIATGEPYSVEVRHFHIADQTYRWILTTALPLRDGEGRIIKWYGSCVDTHDRKLVEEALKASERRLTQTIDTIPAYVFSAGPDGSVNYLNPQMRAWFGRAEEKILAAEWVHLTHPDDRDGTVEAWLGAVAAGTPYQRELRFLHNSGEYRWCDNRAQPLRDGEGAIIAWHGVVNDIHDRKLAEEAVKDSERHLRLTIDTIPALAWSARTDGTGNFFNQHYLDYVGLSLEQVRGWEWTQVVHPDDLGALAEAWESFRAAGTGGGVEARIRRHDGVYRWFLFRTQPLRDDSGQIVQWYGVNADIEEQKRATAMLAGEKQLLERIASGRSLRDVLETLCRVVEEASPGCICEIRPIDERSATFEFAVAPSMPVSFIDAITGTPARGDLSPCGLAAELKVQVIAADLDADARWHGSPVRTRLHEHGLKSVWSTPILSKAGGILGSLCIYHRTPANPLPHHQDIMGRAVHVASIAIERLRDEEELRRRAHLLTTSERISETGSFFWDLGNNKLVWSTQMYRIHELEEGLEPVYPNLLATVHPDDFETIKDRTARLFQGETSPDGGYRIVFPDGRIKYLRTSYSVARQEDGRLESIGVAQDVTSWRLAEDALDTLRSELAHITRVMSLGELAASIAHEVNQPLAGIITNANTGLRMLALDPPDFEGAIKTAQRTLRDGNRASEVIKRLRGLFRKQDFAPEPLNLNEAAQEVMAICTHDLQRRRIALAVTLDPKLPPVFGDRIQLQQVILNLILNAADAIESGGHEPRRIMIETTQATPGVAQLSVSDTGIGLAADDLGRIFEAFYTTKPNGMGIGLSVSRSILDRHDGRLWASANDGTGSTFAFSLPCAPDDAAPATQPRKA